MILKKLVFTLPIILFFLSSCSVTKNQETTDPQIRQESDEIIIVVEDMPRFQGGDVNTFQAWVQERVKYPEEALEENISGTVYIMFTVETDGSLGNVSVMRGVHPALDKETVKVVESAPKWDFGMQRGKPVSVKFSIAIEYKPK